MIFPSKQYLDYNRDDFNSFKEWGITINEDIKYCKKIPYESIFEFQGKCEPHQLPFYHPYWLYTIVNQKYPNRDDIGKIWKDYRDIKFGRIQTGITLKMIKEQLEIFIKIHKNGKSKKT